ncbi:sialate O-acetylesterase [Rhizomicrobium palustre]|uniref:Sialate O-acetylesterase n=1 Tax=Rhizomicrobium palustre TaxID=189966 RepID=A0A846MZK1_9PROT|nr:sialate O-acetylesterase [Rhizomicrobium palustre]NIK89048.1 sialate O-acetylesterase [Rhizomicrobium palustre]
MDKSALAVLGAAFMLSACSSISIPPLMSPSPVVAVVKDKDVFPPRPLTLLYTTFQDHAVLQRDKPVPIWGKTAPGATVAVTFAGEKASATADEAGRWEVRFAAMKAGGPYTIAATSTAGETQTVKDIMIGDVYLCSGQSNMEMPLRLATNYDSELRAAQNPKLRLFHVQRFSSPMPRESFGADASWAVTTPETAKDFSAVCYYFGANIQPVAGVAVGLIEDAWGGAAIQAWISNDKLKEIGGYEERLEIAKTYAKDPKAAEEKWRDIARAWFDAHDPNVKAYSDPGFDDSGWASHDVTGTWRLWNVPELKTFNGITWLRKTITLTEAEAQAAATLSLGPIDSEDLTFVNGSLVGAAHAYDKNRNYKIEPGVLHAGQNNIAIAIQAGAGPAWPGEKMSLKTNDGKSIALNGPWHWKASAKTSGGEPWMPWYNQFGVSTLYNGMILPLGSTQIRGTLWYQGETDAGQPKEYDRLLRAMIADWRVRFGAEMPFYIVQLTSFGPATAKPEASNWAALREVQRRVVDTVPNTGLAVTIDLGSPDVIHPAAKQEVGRRLSLLARKFIYGQDIVAQSPEPSSISRKGKTVTITFDHAAKGLEAREWDRAVGFSLCDAKSQCGFVDGFVTGNSVKLDAAKYPKATSVRFCWADSPLCNLVNSDGLPAVPFEMAISPAKKH